MWRLPNVLLTRLRSDAASSILTMIQFVEIQCAQAHVGCDQFAGHGLIRARLTVQTVKQALLVGRIHWTFAMSYARETAGHGAAAAW